MPPRICIGIKALFLEPFDRAFMGFSDYSEEAIKCWRFPETLVQCQTPNPDQGLKNTWKPLVIMVYRL